MDKRFRVPVRSTAQQKKKKNDLNLHLGFSKKKLFNKKQLETIRRERTAAKQAKQEQEQTLANNQQQQVSTGRGRVKKGEEANSIVVLFSLIFPRSLFFTHT